MIEKIQDYWNHRIHDLEMTDHPVGTKAFFVDLDDYRFDKLQYLPKLVDFASFRGLRVLEVGCGIGTDLVRFAKGGAKVTGVDVSQTVPERFPVRSRLHKGWKGIAFNTMFVGSFNALPRAVVRPLGWHLMAFCRK